MSLFNGGNDKNARGKVRIRNFLIFILFFLLLIYGFDFFNRNTKSKQKTDIADNVSYNLTPTPTITPIQYPQLFYFKTKIGENIKFPATNTNYVLSGNNDDKYKYWYVLITAPASDDITFISYMFEIGEKTDAFENVGNDTKNERYKFVKGLLK